MVVGRTPFHRSACTRVTRFGLVPSALARASMAAASASPVILMFDALASPFNRVASALACASARTVAMTMLAMESCEVVRLRLEKFANHDNDAEQEARLMVSEKIIAAFEAGVNWLAGAKPEAIIGRYREQVAANVKRLSAI
jgi:hypothetical protein